MTRNGGMTGDYAARGTYHEELDPNWPYYPVYVEKKRLVFTFLEDFKGKKILDLGSGEGVFVRDLKALGHDIHGLDLHVESDLVTRGSILAPPYQDQSFDIILCLDVIEHLNPNEQPVALGEIRRLLRPEGVFVCSVPNLAHLASRFTFMFLGRLLRTSSIDRHPGDRPYGEDRELIQRAGFEIRSTRALFPTEPLICLVTMASPRRATVVHRIYNAILNWPGLSFLVIFFCRKRR